MPAKAPKGWFEDMRTNFGANTNRFWGNRHQNRCSYPRTTPVVPLLACGEPKFLTVYSGHFGLKTGNFPPSRRKRITLAEMTSFEARMTTIRDFFHFLSRYSLTADPNT